MYKRNEQEPRLLVSWRRETYGWKNECGQVGKYQMDYDSFLFYTVFYNLFITFCDEPISIDKIHI